jgi:hypothetical protein
MPPHVSLVDDVHEDQLFHVWRTNPARSSTTKRSPATTRCAAFCSRPRCPAHGRCERG